ncbi:hypothetical protein AUC43_09930 [Hymenobacter sedentarius]|uniref:Uncharacterized protein n=1 Tax=Hymenobacter sedentarius TaxID=1411621 RepID=A0A0U4C564_9BACT|nr:hypothetical protein [Hymenobacter sedentarius]ALW85384.1 hypothetical protein AUC43_09930 [Hymenobacter sedentarius]
MCGPLRGDLDVVSLTAALEAGSSTPVRVLLVTDPAELPDLLALHDYSRLSQPNSEESDTPDKSLDSSLEEAEL